MPTNEFWTIRPHFVDYVNYNYLNNNHLLHVISKVLGRTGFAALAPGAVIAYLAKYHFEKMKYYFTTSFK